MALSLLLRGLSPTLANSQFTAVMSWGMLSGGGQNHQTSHEGSELCLHLGGVQSPGMHCLQALSCAARCCLSADIDHAAGQRQEQQQRDGAAAAACIGRRMIRSCTPA